MAQVDDNGYWIDRRGKKTPPEHIDPVVKHRDRTVEMCMKEAKALQEKMLRVKKSIFARIQKHVDYVEHRTGVHNTGKGNLSLTGFSGDMQVEYRINDKITLDERLQSAKTLIDELLETWSDGANRNLVAVVNHAFDVDKSGRVNTHAILKLRSVKIRNKKWEKAMILIADSITVNGSRQYLHFKVRNKSDIFESINLNFSSL